MGASDEDGREIARLGAKVESLEDEVATLRDRSHKHASVIQAASSNASVALKKITALEKRVRSLEIWRAWIIGAAAATGAALGSLATFITRKFGGT